MLAALRRDYRPGETLGVLVDRETAGFSSGYAALQREAALSRGDKAGGEQR